MVTLPGALVGVLLSTGSAAQAGAVQIVILLRLESQRIREDLTAAIAFLS